MGVGVQNAAIKYLVRAIGRRELPARARRGQRHRPPAPQTSSAQTSSDKDLQRQQRRHEARSLLFVGATSCFAREGSSFQPAGGVGRLAPLGAHQRGRELPFRRDLFLRGRASAPSPVGLWRGQGGGRPPPPRRAEEISFIRIICERRSGLEPAAPTSFLRAASTRSDAQAEGSACSWASAGRGQVDAGPFRRQIALLLQPGLRGREEPAFSCPWNEILQFLRRQGAPPGENA